MVLFNKLHFFLMMSGSLVWMVYLRFVLLFVFVLFDRFCIVRSCVVSRSLLLFLFNSYLSVLILIFPGHTVVALFFSRRIVCLLLQSYVAAPEKDENPGFSFSSLLRGVRGDGIPFI